MVGLNANVPAPRIMLVAPTLIDAIERDMVISVRCGTLDRSKGIKVLGIEVAPDRRVSAGIGVFVDENFKFVGATVIHQPGEQS